MMRWKQIRNNICVIVAICIDIASLPPVETFLLQIKFLRNPIKSLRNENPTLATEIEVVRND